MGVILKPGLRFRSLGLFKGSHGESRPVPTVEKIVMTLLFIAVGFSQRIKIRRTKALAKQLFRLKPDCPDYLFHQLKKTEMNKSLYDIDRFAQVAISK